MLRTTKTQQEQTEFSLIENTALDNSLRRCYVCKSLMLHGRTISGKQGLHICNPCDGVETVHKTVLKRTTKIEPEEAYCHHCNKRLIDMKRVEKIIKKKTASGNISELDKERIAKQIKSIGWTYLGQNKYVHNRCK